MFDRMSVYIPRGFSLWSNVYVLSRRNDVFFSHYQSTRHTLKITSTVRHSHSPLAEPNIYRMYIQSQYCITLSCFSDENRFTIQLQSYMFVILFVLAVQTDCSFVPGSFCCFCILGNRCTGTSTNTILVCCVDKSGHCFHDIGTVLFNSIT